jgi:uncharacterized protein
MRIPLTISSSFMTCLMLGLVVATHVAAQVTANPGTPPLAPVSPNAALVAETKIKAEAGDAAAQYAFGRAYEDGQGVPQDDEKAVLWYRKSADQGFAKAQTALGLMYRLGHGVEQDKTEAVRWYQKAAKQQDPAALFNLAAAHYNGDGVGPNTWTAYKYFLIARKAGSKPAEDGVNRIAATLRPDEIGTAMLEIAEMYERGVGVGQSYSEAAAWYEEAIRRGNNTAPVNLARLYDNGTGVAQDFSKALVLCEEAAKRRVPRGQVCAGFHYQRGWGVQKNPLKAAKWYEEAMKLNNGMAFYLLGHMYWTGEGVNLDKRRGYEYLLLVAAAGDPQAGREIGNLKTEIDPKDAKRAENDARTWVKLHGEASLVNLRMSMN